MCSWCLVWFGFLSLFKESVLDQGSADLQIGLKEMMSRLTSNRQTERKKERTKEASSEENPKERAGKRKDR